MQQVEISASLWEMLINELRKRGRDKRESGAFLLAPLNETKIVDFICYDDCDPDCLNEGYIRFSSEGYSELWDYCKKNNKHVIADIHTHPGVWTKQSDLDKEHPMILFPGHVALIVPCYAKFNDRSFKGVGAYEYQGSKKWKTFILKKNMMTNGNK